MFGSVDDRNMSTAWSGSKGVRGGDLVFIQRVDWCVTIAYLWVWPHLLVYVQTHSEGSSAMSI